MMNLDFIFKRVGRVLRCSLLASTLGIAFGAQAQAVGAGQGVSDTEILIGSVSDLSGPVASIGGPQRDGMILAAEEINAGGGIHGRKIRLLVEDSSYDPKKGVLVTQKLLSQDKVFALVGTFGSAVMQATLPLSLERNVPMLFPMASGDITYLPHHPLKFALLSVASDSMRVAVKYAYEQLGKRRMGIIYQDDETGQSALRAAEAQLKVHGLTLIEKTTHKRGDTNFASQVARIKSANVDILLLGTNPRETAAIAIESRAQSWPVDLLTYTGLNKIVIDLGGAAVEGLRGTTQFVNTAQELTPGYLALAERFKTRFGRDIQDGVNFGYVSMMLFAEGAKNAGRNLTPLSLSQGLEKVQNFKTVFGASPITYTSTDHSPPHDAIVMQVVGGKWKIITAPMTY